MSGRYLTRFCGLLAMSVLILPAIARSRDQPIEPESAFRTSSDLVLINARVLDGRGHPLNGREAGRFHLFEGGVEQKLVAFNQGDVPVSIVLVLDDSNSMKGLLGRSREAVSLLLKAANPEDEFALVDQVQSYWSNFARTGDPNGPDLPPWPLYSRTDDPYLAISAEHTTARTNLRSEICPLYIAHWSEAASYDALLK